MKKRSVNIAGHQTSISLEEEFWTELKRIAAEQGLSMNKLVAEIDEQTPEPKNLSSALRLYVLRNLRSTQPNPQEGD